MSEELVRQGLPPASFPRDSGTSELAAAIVEAVNANQGPRKIGVARYIRERSVHRGKPFLARKTSQNGITLDETMLDKDQIEMFNALKPGVYCGGTFVVVMTQDGSAAAGVDLRYNNKTPDQRYNLKSNYPSLSHILAAILREQEANAIATA